MPPHLLSNAPIPKYNDKYTKIITGHTQGALKKPDIHFIDNWKAKGLDLIRRAELGISKERMVNYTAACLYSRQQKLQPIRLKLNYKSCPKAEEVDLAGDSGCASYGEILPVEMHDYEYAPQMGLAD